MEELDDTSILVEICDHPILSKTEQIALVRRAQAGDNEARKTLARVNLRLIVRLARQHFSPYASPAITLLDVIQEGYFGLHRAITCFNPDMGFAFSTYAVWWIRQSVQRIMLYQGRTLHLPASQQKRMTAMYLAHREYIQAKGHLPTLTELARWMKVSEEKLQPLLNAQRPPVRLDEVRGNNGNAVDGGRPILETLAVDEVPVEEIAEEDDFCLRVNALLHRCNLEGVLDLRTVRMLRMRFGLAPYTHAHSLEEIGAVFGLTRERVRQIISNEAFPVLRQQPEMEALHAYLRD